MIKREFRIDCGPIDNNHGKIVTVFACPLINAIKNAIFKKDFAIRRPGLNRAITLNNTVFNGSPYYELTKASEDEK